MKEICRAFGRWKSGKIDGDKMARASMLNWFEQHSDITQLLVGVFDYNGVLRGKRMPVAKLPSLVKSGFKMPISILQTDIWGRDIEGSPLIFETGDADGHVSLSQRTPLRLDWMAEPTALIIGSFTDESGTPDPACPKGCLAIHQDKLASHGSHIKAGVEMEFYLLGDGDGKGQAAPSLAMGTTLVAGDTLSAHHLDDYDVLLSQINKLCLAQDIAIDTVTSELGTGQFEITFQPKSDLVTLAEDILVFKYMVKGLAKSHGIRASFMAKPLSDEAGNGMHVHASLLNKAGDNLFHDDTSDGAKNLGQAVAGIITSMRDSTLILAPNSNSYRRLVPSSHAPTKICWGMDNRTASIRIPASPAIARRLEYRSAGADCNPYLLLAVIAAGIAKGFDEALVPPPAITGNAYEQEIDELPCEMGVALGYFAESDAMRSALGAALHSYFIGTKRQEWHCFAQQVSRFEFDSLSNNI